MVDIADKHGTAGYRLNLRVTSQTKICITLGQQLGVDRPVRAVANGAAFAQGRMLEDERPRLFAVALAAGVVLARHSEPAGGFEDVTAMRVVALGTVHLLFEDRMMLGQVECRFRRTVALETSGWVFARVYNELPSAAAG
jgi:hypothetical protein